MQAYERLIKYARIHTTSDEDTKTSPSTDWQFDLARLLADEMQALGFTDVRVSETAYVYGCLPATPGLDDRPALGFIAHLDTSPTVRGDRVQPRIWPNYDGGDLILSAVPENPVVLSPARFPHLAKLTGRTLITTDGHTLLGADDKAGIAEILTACEIVLLENRPHGKICVAFTPDEEVGRGTEHFDVAGFGADFAYTMDGGEEGELEYENFNAAEAKIVIKGVAVHPGTAKDIMVNALTVACELNALLPAAEVPRHTAEREGFYYLHKLEGNPENALMSYSLRDHNAQLLEGKKQTVRQAAALINERYGEGTVAVEITDRYRNMFDIISQHMHLVDNARLAMAKVGLEPIIVPMRGGTDGATLSYLGLPCPNLGTGGFAYHGVHEHITMEGMEKCKQLILELVALYSK
ncbi:MAG TPA: peptidase T [Clostridiales bacterium]|nr:peptidase T [Clostridiales bacterium]